MKTVRVTGDFEIFELSGAESIGLQFYTGSEAASIFSPGRFTTQTGFVVITAVGPAVPEPATWAMMLAGFVGLGYAASRKKGVGRAISAQDQQCRDLRRRGWARP